jgi:hypothetical protein
MGKPLTRVWVTLGSPTYNGFWETPWLRVVEGKMPLHYGMEPNGRYTQVTHAQLQPKRTKGANAMCHRLSPSWTMGVCHIVALPCTLKSILKAKKEEELWKLKYFTHANIYIYIYIYNLPQKNPLIEETKILQDIIITL